MEDLKILTYKSWGEIISKFCNRLLEDNQMMSLPTIIIDKNQKYLFTFVYSINLMGKSITVSQKHLWSLSKHEMIICNHNFSIDILDLKRSQDSVYKELYFNNLIKIYDLSFEKLNNIEDKKVLERYMDSIKNCGSLLKIYETLNPQFFKWLYTLNT